MKALEEETIREASLRLDARTKEVISLEISTDEVHNAKTFPGLVEGREEEANLLLAGRRGLRLGYGLRGAEGLGH